jgi:hypothetical protein
MAGDQCPHEEVGLVDFFVRKKSEFEPRRYVVEQRLHGHEVVAAKQRRISSFLINAPQPRHAGWGRHSLCPGGPTLFDSRAFSCRFLA